MIVFMIKPLFAGRPRHAQPLALHPAVDQRLFTLVTQICQRVGAPFPARIDVCCELTASASFRCGVLSFLGNDLVLTLGMPLVAGLTVEQLTVVLAHELGHFSQGFGMRLTYLIRTINTWLIRVAYQRDDWDYALEEWAQRADPRFRIIIVVAQLGVWFSRWILKGLVHLGHFIGCFMMREMEYHADLFGIRIGGSNAFESMIKRLHVLEYVLAKTAKDIRPAWNINKTLPENLPTLVAFQESRIPGPVKVQLEDTAGIGTTHWFHSHPSSGDRIRRSRMAADPGMFRLSGPASSLFANFEVLSKQVTSLYYSEDLGIPLALASFGHRPDTLNPDKRSLPWCQESKFGGPPSRAERLDPSALELEIRNFPWIRTQRGSSVVASR
jgi:Zn-dependent protease with chaperone function